VSAGVGMTAKCRKTFALSGKSHFATQAYNAFIAGFNADRLLSPPF
jgi:hypothetical protein